MDALPIVPAVVLSFAATYYLGKGTLALFIESLEQSRRTKLPAEPLSEMSARLTPADNLG